ncbi:MAG: thiamine pyrophosphate-dependent enzyme, partial [Kordiimonas sp.]
DLQTRVWGKEILPHAGEYTGQVLRDGIAAFKKKCDQGVVEDELPVGPVPVSLPNVPDLSEALPARPAGLCTGCPERPVFTAMKLIEQDMGPFHVSADIGCHLFSILPPFNIGNTTMGYGLGWAGASAFNAESDKRTISVMGDGGFWHNGLTSGVGNAVFNNNDNVLVVIDNGYSAATGGQDILSSRAFNKTKSTNHSIQHAIQGMGVKWLRTVTTYDLTTVRNTLQEALTTKIKGPKVIVAESECMLNKQRRIKPQIAAHIKGGKRIVKTRFGVDPDTCTGDHSCIRLSGCPSLTIKDNPDPLKDDPIAHVNNDCVGCGHCGEVSHAAVLCPSFYKAELVFNATWWDRLKASARGMIIRALQRRAAKRRAKYSFGV